VSREVHEGRLLAGSEARDEHDREVAASSAQAVEDLEIEEEA
jgi:hypothetical protein